MFALWLGNVITLILYLLFGFTLPQVDPLLTSTVHANIPPDLFSEQIVKEFQLQVQTNIIFQKDCASANKRSKTVSK